MVKTKGEIIRTKIQSCLYSDIENVARHQKRIWSRNIYRHVTYARIIPQPYALPKLSHVIAHNPLPKWLLFPVLFIAVSYHLNLSQVPRNLWVLSHSSSSTANSLLFLAFTLPTLYSISKRTCQSRPLRVVTSLTRHVDDSISRRLCLSRKARWAGWALWR